MSSIRRLIADGTLPSYQIRRHGRLLVSRAELDEMIRSKAVEVKKP